MLQLLFMCGGGTRVSTTKPKKTTTSTNKKRITVLAKFEGGKDKKVR